MDSSAKFWDRMAERYNNRPIADEATYEKKLAVTRQYLRPDSKVLEFGCGTGSTAIAHGPYVKQIHGIDISSKMIEIAQRKANNTDAANVTFEQASIDELTAPDESFDAVLGLSILHLVEDKEAVIAKIYNMLKPGGVFVSSTACIADSMKFFKVIAPIGKFLRVMPLVTIFSETELVKSLTSVGFRIEHQWLPGKGKAVFIVAKKPG